ncbi:MAG: hypothetical protein M1383_02120 [Patescibacteria group bacterium]|nr:hypothetical protein [Patescibacteria group bacterium]
MISIFLGPDDFTKKEYIKSLAEKQGAVLEVFRDAENAPRADKLAERDLFAKKKILVLENLLSKYAADEKMAEKLAGCPNDIIFLEEKLDKRSSANKKILANKFVTTKEFALPHGKNLDKWIMEKVKFYQGKINPKAADLLARKLGRDEALETKFGGKVADVKEVYNLWQADNEVKKLLALSGGGEILENDIEELVVENGEVDVFKIINALADNKKNLALGLVQDFLDSGSGDEKAKIIQLNALISEQFRNILAVQDLLSRKVMDEEILSRTSWKSGRLYVMKKNAVKFSQVKAKELLAKLEHLDEELKTSATPPRVLLDLILAQM